MKKLSVMLAMAALVSLNSCNTAIGFGRDLRQLGTGMENKAHGREWDGSQSESQDTLPTY